MSTGGAAMNAMMKQMVADSKVGIIKTPNQPTYRRLSVAGDPIAEPLPYTAAITTL